METLRGERQWLTTLIGALDAHIEALQAHERVERDQHTLANKIDAMSDALDVHETNLALSSSSFSDANLNKFHAFRHYFQSECTVRAQLDELLEFAARHVPAFRMRKHHHLPAPHNLATLLVDYERIAGVLTNIYTLVSFRLFEFFSLLI